MVRRKGFIAVVGILPAVLCGIGWPAPAAAQGQPAEPEAAAGQGAPGEEGSALGRVWRKVDQFREILYGSRQTIGNWDYHATALRIMIERIWQEHGTGSESDRFARDLAIRIAEVPPWKMQYVHTAAALLRERYNMNDEQAVQLSGIIDRAAFQVFLRNTDVMLTVGREMATVGGLTGDPRADAERMVRWAQLCKPLRADVLRSVEAGAQQIIASLDPEHQRLAREDLKTFQRWHAHGGRLMDKWIAGDWRYEDLGLSHQMFDPRWLEAQMRQRRAAAAAASQESPPGQADGEPADAWTAYVQGFIRRHGLDAAQRQTALAVLRDLRERAVEHMLSHRIDLQELDRRAAQAPAQERPTVERERKALLGPIEEMFQELKDRLEAVLTAAQRATASRPADR